MICQLINWFCCCTVKEQHGKFMVFDNELQRIGWQDQANCKLTANDIGPSSDEPRPKRPKRPKWSVYHNRCFYFLEKKNINIKGWTHLTQFCKMFPNLFHTRICFLFCFKVSFLRGKKNCMKNVPSVYIPNPFHRVKYLIFIALAAFLFEPHFINNFCYE